MFRQPCRRCGGDAADSEAGKKAVLFTLYIRLRMMFGKVHLAEKITTIRYGFPSGPRFG